MSVCAFAMLVDAVASVWFPVLWYVVAVEIMVAVDQEIVVTIVVRNSKQVSRSGVTDWDAVRRGLPGHSALIQFYSCQPAAAVLAAAVEMTMPACQPASMMVRCGEEMLCQKM